MMSSTSRSASSLSSVVKEPSPGAVAYRDIPLRSQASTSSSGSSHDFGKRSSKVAAKEVGCGEEEWRTIPQRDRLLLTLFHTFQGVMSLLSWNMVLNMVMIFEQTIWPGAMMSDILMGCNQAGAVGTILVMMFHKRLILNFKVSRGINFFTMCVLSVLPLPIFFANGADKSSTGKGVMAVLAFCLGICAGVSQTQSYAYGALIKRRKDQSVWVSTGNGIAGVISWLTQTICFEVVFEKGVLRQQQYVCLVLVIVALLTLLVTHIFLELCMRIEIFKTKVDESHHSTPQDGVVALEEGAVATKDSPSLLSTFKNCWFPACTVGFVLLMTIFVFPACAPYSWPISTSMMNINMGIFQVGDLVFRFFPMLGSWTILSPRLTTILIYLRPIVFFPLIIIPAYLPDAKGITHPAFLIIIMLFWVMSNGWLMTCAIMWTMGTPRSKKELETTANFMTLSIVLSCMIASFASKIPIIGL